MHKRFIKQALILFSFLFLVANCDKGAALAPLQKEAMKLVGEHTGKLTGIKDMLGPLVAKAGAIPDAVPGASALKAALGSKMGSLTTMMGTLGGAEGKIGELVKAGNKEGLTSFLGELKGMGAQATELEAFGKDTTAKLGELEKIAAAGAEGESGMDFSKTLSTGYELKGSSTGIENMLLAFLDDGDMAVDKTKWFNFDRLTFASGSSNLDMGLSKSQLQNMSEILKAYPDMTVKLGGYTDNTGKLEANVKISQARADAVKKALVDMGADAARMTTEGYGPAHPVCEANDTPACKKQNRRIAVNVTKK